MRSQSRMAECLHSPHLLLQVLDCLPVLYDSMLLHLEFLVDDLCDLLTCPFDIQNHLFGLSHAVVEDFSDQLRRC